jgi:hypothetical protein
MGMGAAVSFATGLVESGGGGGTALMMAACGIGAWLSLRAVRRVAV